MGSKVSTPVAVLIILVVAAAAAFFVWKGQQPKAVPLADPGTPLTTAGGQFGNQALHDMWKDRRVLPPSAPSQGAPPGGAATPGR